MHPLDLAGLLGLGDALVGPFAMTGVASGFAAGVLAFFGLAGQAWAQLLLRVLSLVLSLVANALFAR